MNEPLGERLARVETKIDSIMEHLETSLHPLERRVQILERWKAWLLGAGAVVSGLVAWAMSQLSK